jgi:serine/threonine protein kinase
MHGVMPIAIKKLNRTETLSDVKYEHLIDELVSLSVINDCGGKHRNCLPCLSFFMLSGSMHLVFPLCICDCKVFYNQSWQFCDIGAPIIGKFIMEILDALEFLHSHGITHRDVKADNVFLCIQNGVFSAKLADYGSSTSLVTTTRPDGTGQYAAPEIFPFIDENGEKKQLSHGRLVDYWALGILIYVLITNRLPFRTRDHKSTRVYREWTQFLHDPKAMHLPRQSIFYKEGEPDIAEISGITVRKLKFPGTECTGESYHLLAHLMDCCLSPNPKFRVNDGRFAYRIKSLTGAINYDLFLRFILSLPSDKLIGRELLLDI